MCSAVSSGSVVPVGSLLLIMCLAASSAVNAEETTPGGVDSGWWSRVQQRITEQEYHVTWQEGTGAWHAPNRAHNLRIYFTEQGIRVVPRTEPEPSWEWGLSLSLYGRPGSMRQMRAAHLLPSENGIEYDRGDIIEWYVNSAEGLEQGFTLPSPPDGIGPVRLEMELYGSLSPTIRSDGRSIDFRTPAGAGAIRYSKLIVHDATGRELSAWMEGFNREGLRGIRILVDDTDAVYPVTVDPLATSPSWSVDGDQATAYFGWSVSTAGDVNGDGYSDVIVGAYSYDNGELNEGRAYVYHGSAAGLSATENWTAEGDQVSAYFGNSVSTAGDVDGDGFSDVIVGAYSYDNGETDEGRVFVYHGSMGGLSATADWTAESDQADSDFGRSVGTAGDVNGDGYSDVIVGAEYYDNGEADEGMAFVYRGSAAGLGAAASWTAESDLAGANFGHAVATAGDVNGDGYADVIVGSYDFVNGETGEGMALVYHGSSSGLNAGESWRAEGDQTNALFGYAVGTAGDVDGDGYADVIVGARNYDNGETDEGRVVPAGREPNRQR